VTAPQAIRKIASPSALHPVQAANSNPKKVAPNSTTTAPRPVSLIDTDPRGRG
jgi:hypothetical protein